MLFLKQPLILPFIRHKSETNCQNDSNTVSNSKLKPDLCNCVKIEIIDLLAIQQRSLDRAFFSYIFMGEVRLSGVRTSITIVHIRKFFKM